MPKEAREGAGTTPGILGGYVLGVAHVPGMSEEVHVLYIEHGCRFVPATPQQIQEILNALDGAMALWDMEHPEIFFRTLELNFPELRRHTP